MPGVYSFSLFLCRQRLQFPDTRRLPVNHLLLLIHFLPLLVHFLLLFIYFLPLLVHFLLLYLHY